MRIDVYTDYTSALLLFAILTAALWTLVTHVAYLRTRSELIEMLRMGAAATLLGCAVGLVIA